MGLFKKKANKTTSVETIKINSNADFWNWFTGKADFFHKTVKDGQHIQRDFLDLLSAQLDQLDGKFNYLTGMYNQDTVELILTADGIVKNIVFIEELVAASPQINGWKFTSSKPPFPKPHQGIRLENMNFDSSNINFYSNDHPDRPDEVNLTFIYDGYKEELKDPIYAGVFIFLDNYLGELTVVNEIDEVKITGPDQAEETLIPVEKLADYLNWRQKEFVEKYEGTIYNTENDQYSSLEATLNNGLPLIAIINTTLLNWNSKASHPWILVIDIYYEGNENGMPDNDLYTIMNEFEDELMAQLKTADGHLNIGRETADGLRKIYFACKDYRIPSKMVTQLSKKYQDKLRVDYNLYKDKYWKTLDQFKPES